MGASAHAPIPKGDVGRLGEGGLSQKKKCSLSGGCGKDTLNLPTILETDRND